MPGTILLTDYEAANKDELAQHLADLMARSPTASDSLTNPVIQAPAPEPMPLIAAPTPSDSLTNPVIQPTPEPSPQAQQTRDELQAHLDGLMAPDTSAAPPVATTDAPVVASPAPSPPVVPAEPSEPTTSPAVSSAPPRPLQLLGEGLTSLNAGAQNVRQELQNHLTSLLAPPTTADVAGPPSPDAAVQHDPSPPVQTPGTQVANTPDATGRVFPLTITPSNAPSATYHLKGGSDLMAPRGTPVLNMQAGRVEEVFTDNGSHTVGGNAVLVHGDDGLDYYYAHFDQPTGLKPGQRVETGVQIGAVGNSGNAYKGGQGETHLHIGIGHGISNGVGAEGGLGQNFDAQKLLTDLEGGVGKAAPAPSRGGPVQAAVGAVQAKVGQGQQDFVNSLQPLAQEVANRTGIDPNVMVAIAANETGWGRSQTAQQQNNLFSIQGDGSNGSRWATYSSPTQAFDAFTNLIRTAPRYAQAWQDRGDPGKFVDDLRQAGYVVDEPGFPAQGWVDQVKSIYGRLPASSDQAGPSPQRAAALGSPGVTTDQQAASVDQPRPLQLLGEGFSALGSGAQNVASGVQGAAAGAAQGGLKIIDNAINAVADTSGPQTAAMQPTPSDTLTNPLGTRNAPEQPSAQLTGQPAGGIAEPTGPAVLPSIGEAKDALLQGDTQAALDALNRAGTAISTSAPAQAIAENQANPPLAGVREAIANAPVLGGALGMARGPDLLSQDELLRTPEADTARAILEQMNRGAPVADADVAEAARTLLTSQAVAMTGEGVGRPVRTATANMHAQWLKDQPVVPTSDPRPATGAVQFGGPDVKRVTQASLDEITPQGATLYHETSVPSAGALLERIEAGPRNHDPIFTSDNADLALGQGGKGVRLEFDPARANGGVAPQKPGLGFTSATGGGQEYTVTKTLPGAVKAIVVQTQQQADQLAKSARIARRFDFAGAEQTPDGIRIPYRERAPVAAPEPVPATAAEPVAAGSTQILGLRGEPAAPEATGLGAPSEAATRAAPTGPDAAEVARLRLDKFPDWLQPTIEDAARATDFAIEQRRGVIPNAQAEAMADQVGRSVDDWIKQSKIGTTLNTEETRALRNVITGQAQKVQDLAEQVSAAAERGQATDQLITQAAIEGNKLQDLTTMMEGARAEWGRAGSAWKAETRLIDLPPNEAISEIYKTLGGRDNALAAVQELNALQQSGATPIQLAKFWAKIKNPEAGFQDWVKALRYNSMLSGPRTIEVNGIGNALEIPWRMARDTGASLLRGRPEELAPEASGLVAGFNKGRQAFMETLTHGMTTEQALAGEIPTALADKVRNPALKPVAKVLDVPSRVLAASDAWGKSMAQSMALGRRAGVTASKEGLSGPEWHARVAELLDNPSRDMLKEADAISERMVYHGDMGSMGTALSQLQRVPYLGNAILPFLRTVYHIQARGIDRSPVGLAGTLIDVGRGKYGPKTIGNLAEQLGKSEGPSKGVAPLGERLGDNLAGTAATVGFFQKAQEGAITGAGPDDPEKRDMLRAQGWQPYSLKLGDHYVSYANWGPVATSLAMAAGAAEAIQYRKENAANVPAILVDASRRTAKLITEQSYLQGIGAVWKALEQPDRYSAQTLGQIMTSLVPFGSALNTAGQAMDPLQRQVGKPKDIGLPAYLGESVEARLPGLREQLPPQQDQLGRPIENPQSDLGALNPLRATPIKSNAVLQELLLKGADVGEPPTSVRNVDLTPAEQRTVNEKAGQYIERNVQQVMADPDYQKADADGKKRALSTAVERARRQAGGELLQSLSEAEVKRRLEESRTKREPVPIGLGG